MNSTDTQTQHDENPTDSVSHEPLWIEDFTPAGDTAHNRETLLLVSDDHLNERFPPFPNPFKHPLRAFGWIVRGMFGLASLILLLAVVAAIPILNFLTLGYLLEAEGRVARSGKIRDAFPLIGLAPRMGSIAIGFGLWILPLSLLAGYAADAALIDSQSGPASALSFLTPMLAILVTLQLCIALALGGKLWHFLPVVNLVLLIRKLRAGGYWVNAAENIKRFISQLRLKHHFSLGLRGFLGAMTWLFLPSLLLAQAETTEGGPILLTILGGFLLIFVFSWLPFLQARFAAENRFKAIFEIKPVIECFTKAPLACLLATTVTFVFALPLYLLKVRLPPQDAMWLATLVFIVSIYPARIITGLAYGRATRKVKRAWFDLGWLCRSLMLVLIAAFVFLSFFSQAIGEHGKRMLFEHHAFLLPWPL